MNSTKNVIIARSLPFITKVQKHHQTKNINFKYLSQDQHEGALEIFVSYVSITE